MAAGKIVKKKKKKVRIVKRKAPSSSSKKTVKKFVGELSFYIQEGDGRTVGVAESIKDLHDKLKTASDDVFRHHLRPGANDFAAWVRKTVKNTKIAKKLESVNIKKSVSSARKKVLKILKTA